MLFVCIMLLFFFFFCYWFLQMLFVISFVLVYWHIVCLFQLWFSIMRSSFNLLVFPNSMFTPFCIWKGYELSGEIALTNDQYYYYYFDDLAHYDEYTSNTAESICIVLFEDNGWKQEKLSICFGSLGRRPVNYLALPAYMCSRASCRRFASTIQPPPSDPSVVNSDDVNTKRS